MRITTAITVLLAYGLCYLAASGLCLQPNGQAAPQQGNLSAEQAAEFAAMDKSAESALEKGHADIAEGIWKQLLQKTRDVHARRDTVHFLIQLGDLYNDFDDGERALVCHREGLEIARELGDVRATAVNLEEIGNDDCVLQQFDSAVEVFEQCLVIGKQLQDAKIIADINHNLGLAYSSSGHYDKALVCYFLSLDIEEQNNDSRAVAHSYHELGLLYHDLGQYDNSLNYCRLAIGIKKKLANPQSLALTLNLMGDVAHHLGQYELALETLQQALDISVRLHLDMHTGLCLNNLGVTYRNMGQTAKALECYKKALEIAEKRQDTTQIAVAKANMGDLCCDDSKYEKALDYLSEALRVFIARERSTDTIVALQNIGSVNFHLNRLHEAENAYSECRKMLESVAYQIGDPAEVGALQEAHTRLYENYAQLLVRQQRPQDALEMLEAGRAQGLARQIDLNHRGDITRYFTPDERNRLANLSLTVSIATARQRLAVERAQDAQTASLLHAAEQARGVTDDAEQKYSLFRGSLFARYPELRRTATGQPALFQELEALARTNPDTLYLEYGIVDDHTTLLFTLSHKDGIRALTLSMGESELSTLAKRWRQTLEHEIGRGTDIVVHADARTSKNEEPDLARSAYAALLGDVDKAGMLRYGRYSRLVFVVSGPILEMPLCALCNSKGERLIERFPISSVICLSDLTWNSNPRAPKYSVLSVADPTGPKMQIPLRGVAGSPQNHSMSQSAAPKRNQNAARAGFGALPGAREEGKEVAAQFIGSKLLVGPEAREETVSNLLPDYQIVHFATHGFVSPRAPLSSALVLADESDPGKFDGLLTASKIMNIPISARLAVLSACETGRGTPLGGEGLLGLAWAFRAAGCPSLVASQWEVNDMATRRLMISFYKSLKMGQPLDSALRSAILSAKKERSSACYWAAFELIGASRAIHVITH